VILNSSCGYNNHELKIRRDVRKASSRINSLNFSRADINLFVKWQTDSYGLMS